MKSRVELNRDGINYLRKGESVKILDWNHTMKKLFVKREGHGRTFWVSNKLMSLWFSES